MATLAAINSTTPSLQSMLLRSRAEQARRQADSAQADAQALRQQADEQDRIGQDARGRARMLEQDSRAKQTPATVGASNARSNGTTTTQARPAEPTYLQALGGVFRVAKPILALDLSVTQKNIVKSSLFDAATAASGRLLDTAV